MKFPLKTAAAALALAVSSIAPAAIVLNPDGSYTISDDTTIGDSFTVTFDGHPPNEPVIPGLTSELTLTFEGLDGNDWLFSFALENTSGDPIDEARVTAFGFLTDPDVNIGDSDVTSTWYDSIGAGQFPGNNDVEVCVSNNQCTGSQGGPGLGQTATGDLILAFVELPVLLSRPLTTGSWASVQESSLGSMPHDQKGRRIAPLHHASMAVS